MSPKAACEHTFKKGEVLWGIVYKMIELPNNHWLQTQPIGYTQYTVKEIEQQYKDAFQPEGAYFKSYVRLNLIFDIKSFVNETTKLRDIKSPYFAAGITSYNNRQDLRKNCEGFFFTEKECITAYKKAIEAFNKKIDSITEQLKEKKRQAQKKAAAIPGDIKTLKNLKISPAT